MKQKDFAERLAQVRTSSGMAARQLSLLLGQSQSYINSIENGGNFPSLPVFLSICEALKITPSEFFDGLCEETNKSTELLEASRGLDNFEMEHVLAIIKDIKKNK